MAVTYAPDTVVSKIAAARATSERLMKDVQAATFALADWQEKVERGGDVVTTGDNSLFAATAEEAREMLVDAMQDARAIVRALSDAHTTLAPDTE